MSSHPVLATAFALHLLAAVIWVGGMFFAYMALRPAAVALEPPARLALWVRTFARFFPWVWAAVLLLPASGYWMLFQVFGGFKGAAWYIHAMQGIGIVMFLLFMHVFFAPYRRLRAAVARQDWADGARRLGQIRVLVGVNLMLGLITVTLAGIGRHL